MKYDVIIIGAGPAGLSAGLYASRATLNTLIIEKAVIGGQITTTTEIENYPGASEVTGPELVEKMKEQCLSFGANIVSDEVLSVEKRKDGFFSVKTGREEYVSKTCIIASGSTPKELGIKGEREYRGMGVSYCATCDAGFFTGFEVCVIGGGDTALKEAIYLTKFAKKVTIIHRRDQFRGGKGWEKKARANEKIHFLLSHEPVEILGENSMVTAVKVRNKKTGEVYDYKTDGVFMFVGHNPNSALVKNMVDVDEKGYIITDNSLQTSVKGLFVAGDVRQKALRQVVTAASDGAICATGAEEFLDEMNEN
ncbi:thioredoxin-disulfide reductase [Anaerofustis sp.]|uniref:thioredoxin-disulfide reductase n=1 Tax=Anaerofustis sp. TaxID=1872517 RepID=UPI0025C1E16E|nr:thioredoxin-disulfide reductase [Anaerofustis sp.]